MTQWRSLAPVAVCLVAAIIIVGLTYFLVQTAAPDSQRYERVVDALRSLALENAALQRDVLQARTGLLRNYDPLVRRIEALSQAAADLEAAMRVAEGSERAEIKRRIESVSESVRAQDELLEVFKSRNALLQNSLVYFSYMTERADLANDVAHDSAMIDVGKLANAMLNFLQAPHGDATRRLTTALERLQAVDAPREMGQIIEALAKHGHVIIATLPAVDDLVSRLQSNPIDVRARELQESYIHAYGRALDRARVFRLFLYAASVGLAAYVGYLFLLLHRRAENLQERLDLEAMIAQISTHFVSLSRDRINVGLRDALARLAQQTGVERARIVTPGDGRSATTETYVWSGPEAPPSSCSTDALLGIAAGWSIKGYDRQGCIHVPQVDALPDGAEKSFLRACGIRSWLCLPLQLSDRRLGFLTLEAVSGEKHWIDHDVALLRTAGETFATAIARAHAEAEREMLESRLRRAERLEALGTLAGGIAHEFNNILGAILGYGEMAIAVLRKPSMPRGHVLQIMKAGRRAQAVVDQILAFGRRSERPYGPIEPIAAVVEAIDLLRASLPAGIAIRAALTAEGATIVGNATQLQQVVMNLCTNAAHAMSGVGALDIILATIELTQDRNLSHGTLRRGRHVRLAVTDTGHGMTAAVMERIFEPFFTTKPVGKGTGLGLAMVHGIVAQHGGTMNVISAPGCGTTFEAYFPQTEDVALARDRKAPALRGRGETVLLVDDDQAIVRIGEEMLAALGYEPVGFDSSPMALAAYRANPQRFDLVLTDAVMPDISGTDLASGLHQIRPDLPIILMTGHREQMEPEALQAAGIREIVMKPLQSGRIADCLARYLQ